MRKIRKGKDITVRWPILTNGEPLSLDGRDLTLFVKSQYNVAKQVEFTTEDNVVLFTFYGTEQQMLGAYQLTLWENYGKEGQTAVDYCDAFELVSCTCKESGDDEGLKTETVDLESSTIEVGIGGGASAPIEIVQETGESTTAVMSQDAVTKAIRSESERAEKAEQELSDIIARERENAEETHKAFADCLAEEIDRAKTTEQNLAGEIAAETTRATGEETAIRQEFAAADAQEQTERKQKDAETLRLAKEYTDDLDTAIREDFSASDAAMLAEAKEYADDREAAIRTDMAAGQTDTLAKAKSYTNERETGIREDMDTTHAELRKLIDDCVGLPAFDAQDYTLTFTAKNGATVVIDFPLETMGLDYNAETKEMIYTAADGSKRRISLTEFIDIYVGSIGAEIQITVDTGNVIRAALLDNSITWDKLSTAVQTKIDGKVDKVAGKGLSTEDYTPQEKEKLAGIQDGANNFKMPSTLPASMIVQDETHRFVTDAEKSTWNIKVSSTSVNNIAGPITAEEYAALTPDANTLYIVTD